DDHVPDLAGRAVGPAMKAAADDEPTANTCRPRDVDHVASAAAGAAVVLAQAGHVRVVGQVNLGAGGAAKHRCERNVAPARQVGWVHEHPVLDVDRAWGTDGDAVDLLAPAVLLDLGGGPLHHPLRR